MDNETKNNDNGKPSPSHGHIENNATLDGTVTNA